MTMNNFGCIAANVRSRLTTGNYVPSVAELGGDTVIADCIASAVDQIIQSMPEIIFKQMTQIRLEIVERRATASQTVVSTTLTPLVAGKTYVWRAQPRYFLVEPKRKTDLLRDEEFYDPSVYRPLAEMLEGTDYNINVTNGQITFTVGCAVQDMVVVDYTVDVESTDFSIDSLAACAADGAAYMLGSRLYPKASSKWEYIDTLNEQFTKKMSALQDGSWVPPELRLMTFWKEVIPLGDTKSKIQSGRIIRG